MALETGDASQMPTLVGLSAEDLEVVLTGGEKVLTGGAHGDDAVVVAAAALYPAYTADRDAAKALLSERDQLIAALLEIQKARCAAFPPSPPHAAFPPPPPHRTTTSALRPPYHCMRLPHSSPSSALLALLRPRLLSAPLPTAARPNYCVRGLTTAPYAQAHATDEIFYPDANSCLRLSAGHVEGYAAADAVTHTPVTTLGGLVDKHLEVGSSPSPSPAHSLPLRSTHTHTQEHARAYPKAPTTPPLSRTSFSVLAGPPQQRRRGERRRRGGGGRGDRPGQGRRRRVRLPLAARGAVRGRRGGGGPCQKHGGSGVGQIGQEGPVQRKRTPAQGSPGPRAANRAVWGSRPGESGLFFLA